MISVADAIRILGGPRAEAVALEAARMAATYADDLRQMWRRVRRPVTLRDAQRAFVGWRGRPRSSVGMASQDMLSRLIGSALMRRLWAPHHDEREPVRACIDRLVSKYGPDYVLDGLIEEFLNGFSTQVYVEYGLRDAARVATEIGDDYVVVYIFGGAWRPEPPVNPVTPEEARPEATRTDHKIGADAVISNGPHNNEFADTHGGDGNSGEVNHAAATTADDRHGAGYDSASGGAIVDTPDGTCQGGMPGADGSAGHRGRTEAHAPAREDGEMPTCQGDSGGEKPTGEMGTRCGRCGTSGDSSRAGSPVSAMAASVSADAVPDGAGHHTSSGEAESPGGTSIAGYLSGDPILDARMQRLAYRECAEMLARIIRGACGLDGTPSPRIDGRALVRELVSRRVSLPRVYKREVSIRHLIMAVDQSGSCAATVDAMYDMAVRISRELPRGKVSILLHSNGLSIEAGEVCAPEVARLIKENERGLGAYFFSNTQKSASLNVWLGLMKAVDIGLILHIGDTDAYWAMSELANRTGKVLSVERYAIDTDEKWRTGPVTDHLSAYHALRKLVRKGV